MDRKDLLEMKLHESINIGRTENLSISLPPLPVSILRVCGGLIYTIINHNTGHISSCFVPESANHISDSGKKVRHDPTSMSVGSDINVGSKLDDMDATVRELRSVEENSSMAPSVKKWSSLPPEEMLMLHRLIDVDSYIHECAPDRSTHMMSVGDIRFMARTIKGLMGIL